MIRVLFIIVLVAVSLMCCKKEVPKAPQRAAQQRAEVQKPEPAKAASPDIKPQEQKVEIESYTYEPKGRRDPFLSIIEASKKGKEVEKKKGVKSSEAFEVSEIKVIAIAWDRKKSFAMVQFPDKKYYTVKEGMTLGPYGGKVIAINQESIVVRENVKNYKGEMQSKDTILKLRKEEGE